MDIEGRGKQVLFVGGTALYLKTLLRGLFEGPGADPAVRGRLEEEADCAGRRGPASAAQDCRSPDRPASSSS